MGRPRKNIDEAKVKKLAQIGCSYAEIAEIMGCDPSTLTRRFAQAIKKGHAIMHQSLRRKQYLVAVSGNVSMLIWLGKQHLGQSDKVQDLPPEGPLDFGSLPTPTGDSRTTGKPN